MKTIQQGDGVVSDSERGWESLRVAEICFLEEVTPGLELYNKTVKTVD